MARMLEHEKAGDQGCGHGEYGGNGEAEVVESPSSPEGGPDWCFGLDFVIVSDAYNCEDSSHTSFIAQVYKGVVAGRPRHRQVKSFVVCSRSRSPSSKGQESWVKNIKCRSWYVSIHA